MTPLFLGILQRRLRNSSCFVADFSYPCLPEVLAKGCVVMGVSLDPPSYDLTRPFLSEVAPSWWCLTRALCRRGHPCCQPAQEPSPGHSWWIALCCHPGVTL